MTQTELARLTAADRRATLARAGDVTYDVVVVGGGVTGSGVALDAAARGLSVLLVEAADIASGTSSKSGKIVHGGLRYLEQLNFKLVSEALRERDLMVRKTAPHLIEPEPFLFPLTKHWQRPYVGSGVLMYDLMAMRGRTGGAGGVPHHRHLTRAGALRAAPGLQKSAITGALQYYDARMDDARHTLAVARTAASLGADVVTHAKCVDLLREGPQVRGVVVEDTLSGERVEVAARSVVNAGGVWSAEIQAMAGDPSFKIAPAKGTHLVFDGDVFDSSTGILARAEDSVIIMRRWFGKWLLGTTDTTFTGTDAWNPEIERSDVDYLLRNINRYLIRQLSAGEALGAFAGLRPLLAPVGDDAGATSALSRDHSVVRGPGGLVTIVGGKYTTYRTMARDTVDTVLDELGEEPIECLTADIPLVGAAGWPAIQHRVGRLADEYAIDRAHIERMLTRYGDELPSVLAPVTADAALGRPVPGIDGYLAAEFRYAATHEAACTLADVLTRRTRVTVEQPDSGRDAAPAVAAVVGDVLGWDDVESKAQVDAYVATLDDSWR